MELLRYVRRHLPTTSILPSILAHVVLGVTNFRPVSDRNGFARVGTKATSVANINVNMVAFFCSDSHHLRPKNCIENFVLSKEHFILALKDF